jgi:DNA-binding GntR family transcriptional regulator
MVTIQPNSAITSAEMLNKVRAKMASMQTVISNDTPTGGTLATSVFDRLRGDILNGTLKPGEKLALESLRERYSVGNSPVREALNRLSADGLVERQDQKGFRVAAVSGDDFQELLKTRLWLEERALRESIDHGGTAWEERAVLAFHWLSRVPRSLSEETYIENPEWEPRHREFHLSLLSGCQSRWLINFCAQLYDQASRYRRLAVQSSYPKRHELDEHKLILDAAVSNQADEAVELLMSHYTKTAGFIISPALEQANA